MVSWPDGWGGAGELVMADGMDALNEAAARAEGWPRWLARYLVARQDTSTDGGMEMAFARTSKVYGGLSDPLEQRQFREALSEAISLPLEELEPRMARQADTTRCALEPYLVEDLERDIVLARAEGLQTGYEALDQLISVPQGAITIVAAPPGHGKTTLQLNLLTRMLKRYPDLGFAFFSYEESRRALALKLVMMEAGEVLDPGAQLWPLRQLLQRGEVHKAGH